MADNVGSKVSYFLVGLGVGALVGVLFAPKSMLPIVHDPVPPPVDGATDAMQLSEPTCTVTWSVVGSDSPCVVVTFTVKTDADSLP